MKPYQRWLFTVFTKNSHRWYGFVVGIGRAGILVDVVVVDFLKIGLADLAID